jgi:hypothetical protein
MTYQVAICTHNRWETINHGTLRVLKDTGIPTQRIHLFITPGQEPQYEATLDPALYGHLHTGGTGLAANRNAATRAFPKHTRLVQADDDLKAIQQLTPDGKLQTLTNLDPFLQEAFTITRHHKATMWGVYPVPNAFFMRPRISTGLKFLIGQLQGYTTNPTETIQAPDKDDYERTLLRYHADGQVIRFDHITVQANGVRKNAGGLQDGNRVPKNNQAVTYLMNRWPQNVKPSKTRPDGYQEIRLVTP